MRSPHNEQVRELDRLLGGAAHEFGSDRSVLRADTEWLPSGSRRFPCTRPRLGRRHHPARAPSERREPLPLYRVLDARTSQVRDDMFNVLVEVPYALRDRLLGTGSSTRCGERLSTVRGR